LPLRCCKNRGKLNKLGPLDEVSLAIFQVPPQCSAGLRSYEMLPR